MQVFSVIMLRPRVQDKGDCIRGIKYQGFHDVNSWERISMDKPSCFFCGSKRQRNLILVGEDALGNPELIDFDGMGVSEISKAIKYRSDYKKMRRIYWACLRCFYLGPSE